MVRLQSEGLPDAPLARGGHAALPRHTARLRWAAPAGRLSGVCRMTFLTLASSIVRAPGRGLVKAALDKARRRHSPTVCATRSWAAIAWLLEPAAKPNTMREGNAKACAALRPLRIALQYPRGYTRHFGLLPPVDEEGRT